MVCPLVEGSDRVEAASATAEAERLAAGELAGLRIGLLHGQLRPADKEAAMEAFRTGALDVLVATTVIEVGVDVPDASVMVVEDADRFGIAQLHQLRGRVGRSGEPAWCYLLSEADTPEAAARLGALERTTDGFALADVDLDLRGRGPSSAPARRAAPICAWPVSSTTGTWWWTPGRSPSSWSGPTPASRATACWPRSSASSSTRTRPGSCSRAEGATGGSAGPGRVPQCGRRSNPG